MTRQGDGLAGIDGVVELQKAECHMQIPVFFYIGNRKAAIEKLTNNKDRFNENSKIKIGNQLK